MSSPIDWEKEITRAAEVFGDKWDLSPEARAAFRRHLETAVELGREEGRRETRKRFADEIRKFFGVEE